MKDIYQILNNYNIKYQKYDHLAVFTIAEADLISKDIPGRQCKNLFLTNNKGTKHYLITIDQDKKVDLKLLAELLQEKSLRFGSPERLYKYLKLTPGSVSPLGLINDENKEVVFLLDEDLLKEEKINLHPNINTATLGIDTKDFKRLIKELGYEIKLIKV